MIQSRLVKRKPSYGRNNRVGQCPTILMKNVLILLQSPISS